jgi:hypothetical protein
MSSTAIASPQQGGIGLTSPTPAAALTQQHGQQQHGPQHGHGQFPMHAPQPHHHQHMQQQHHHHHHHTHGMVPLGNARPPFAPAPRPF